MIDRGLNDEDTEFSHGTRTYMKELQDWCAVQQFKCYQ